MKTIIIFLVASVLGCSKITGQVRIIKGMVITEDFERLPEVRIKINDSVVVGMTNMEGEFKIEIPARTKQLSLSYIGMEEAPIKLKDDCDILEVIMLYGGGCYFGCSSRKVARLEKKHFNELPGLFLKAYNKSLFTTKHPCYSREYVSCKPALDRIREEEFKIKKQIKANFAKINIGDTIKIPFYGSHKSEGTNTTTLLDYSLFINPQKFDCIIKAIVISKNRYKYGCNLKYEVINCEMCNYSPPLIYMRKAMDVGELFEINMKVKKMLNN